LQGKRVTGVKKEEYPLNTDHIVPAGFGAVNFNIQKKRFFKGGDAKGKNL
jgi:hypothetical protein